MPVNKGWILYGGRRRERQRMVRRAVRYCVNAFYMIMLFYGSVIISTGAVEWICR